VIKDIFFALWFFLPAAIANVVPVLVAPMPFLKRFTAPIDGGLTYRGKRLLGSHKTWRGLISGTIFATLTFWLQQLAAGHIAWVHTWTAQVDYTRLPTIVVGVLFGLGSLGGDALESFFKRQRDVKPGHGWFPFDQIDYIIGGAVATMPFIRLTLLQYAWLIVLWLILHIAAGYIAYWLNLKERPI
jgi:CDP-2,3-bis-(O-geranylgeranyl)-sn-glycerol synthase